MMATRLLTRSFIIIWIVNFLLYLSYTMINPSLPIYFESIGVSGSWAGFCVGMFTLGSILVRQSLAIFLIVLAGVRYFL